MNAPSPTNRRIRIFISSTFRDMIAERDGLMSHAWPALRRLCQERNVELVEVDLRWGIAEEQSTRRETLKLCLDEIRACRPFFIGLLGERYGWVPGDDAFTADLKEEQPWLKDLSGKSVTELEILHGVLNHPEIAGRAFFYFRDPAYSSTRGPDFQSENPDSATKQITLKAVIRAACAAQGIPLHDTYPDPAALAALVLADLTSALEAEFPKENIPDSLSREAQDHEAFAESRRRTYIGRTDYTEALGRHALGQGGPLVLLGDSGSGKSALLANWLEHWRKDHPKDFIVQHYIGGTADSADHTRLMSRVMAEIKRWSGDPDALPTKREDILKDFPLWLAKARARAVHQGVRFILVLDALNQLADQDHARLLGWLPEHPFSGPLRLIVSTLPRKPDTDDPLAVLQKRRWPELRIQPLSVDERRRMITGYLARFGKKLDAHRLDRLASAAPTANPLHLKILLDDLRVTGTYDRLDERLTEYLAAPDIPALLRLVLARYQRDYERDRPGLVSEALGLIFAARRGLSETELLHLLRPHSEKSKGEATPSQLAPAHWTPFRAALEDSLVDRGGILNFAHDYLRTAVEQAFVPDVATAQKLRLRLADDFEALPITARTCDELPWLLKATDSRARLRACLLNIDRFLLIQNRDEEELRGYWIEPLKEERTMGKAYLESFDFCPREVDTQARRAYAAAQLGNFLYDAALYVEAEPLMRYALTIAEDIWGENDPEVSVDLNNLAQLLQATNRVAEAEPLIRRALKIDVDNYGVNHPEVSIRLNNLAWLLQSINRFSEAEPLMRYALNIDENIYGENHANVAIRLNNLAILLQNTNRLHEAEILMRRALKIDINNFGENHPEVAIRLSNVAQLLQNINRFAEAEPLMRNALRINEASYGNRHPKVARDLNNLAQLLQATNQLAEAESLMHRAIKIIEERLGSDHPDMGTQLNNLALLLLATNRTEEAEQGMRCALRIFEESLGSDHPNVSTQMSNLAQLLQSTNRIEEAKLLTLRALQLDEVTYGKNHPKIAVRLNNLAGILQIESRLTEAEPLMRLALSIDEASYEKNNLSVARDLNNLAWLLQATNRVTEAETLIRRALLITEEILGPDHPSVATHLNNLALMLQATDRLTEAEPLMRRHLEIFFQFTRDTGHAHPHLQAALGSYAELLQEMGHNQEHIKTTLSDLGHRFGINLSGSTQGNPNQFSSELRTALEQIMQDPSKIQTIAENLRQNDPEVFIELMKWFESQQQ